MFLKESITTPQNQYAAPSDSISVALQQQLSKARAEIKQLQQAKRHNSYPKTPETSRSFRTTVAKLFVVAATEFRILQVYVEQT